MDNHAGNKGEKGQLEKWRYYTNISAVFELINE